jgi:Ras-related protein Rab-7A
LSQKATIGADFIKKKVKIDNGEMVPLQIWDTAGQERFQSLSNTFYRGADCCVIVFDISSLESYEGIDVWRSNFMESVAVPSQHNDQSMSDEEEPSVPILLVGNKSDLSKQGKRQVDEKQVIADWVDSGEAAAYVETSASDFTNIEQLFEEIAVEANQYQVHIAQQRETINEIHQN